MTLAARYPGRVSGLILVSAPYSGGSWVSQIFVQLTGLARFFPKPLRPLFFLWRNRLLLILLDLILLKYPKFSQTLSRIVYDLQERPRQREEVVEANWLSQISFDYRQLAKLKSPVYFVHGTKDLLIPVGQARKLARFVPQATWEILSDAGHNPQLEAPESLALAVGKCLLR